ncbi:hypothetical protein [Photobacterium arenosum]|uniref:hypothetical protein n=1 Tax=Photobacterium arenosum TaxID=2774143 RepID=UPI0028898D33|nr:hypothetical protein [Photobacterium arenosum]
MQKLRLFVVESLSPLDMLEGRTEGVALEKICKIMGHDVALLDAHSSNDLYKYCDYISSIDRTNRLRHPLCIHLAAHGNHDGIQFGRDFINWATLFEALDPIIKDMNDYNGAVYLSISACGAGEQQIANIIQSEIRSSRTFRDDYIPPEYIFVTKGSGDRDVTMWDDSAVSWTLFYHRLAKLRHPVRDGTVRSLLNDIEKATNTVLCSFRWNRTCRRYERY